MTQKELAKSLNVSERTVKTRTVDLQKKKLLERQNGKRNGKWVVTEEALRRLGQQGERWSG